MKIRFQRALWVFALIAAAFSSWTAGETGERGLNPSLVATPHESVNETLKTAGVAGTDVVYDLGCGGTIHQP